MAAASIVAVLSAFATKSQPESVQGFKLISPGNCVSDQQVDCSNGATQTCIISDIDYRRNTSCEFLTKP